MRSIRFIFFVLLVAAIALGFRLRAVELLPIDYDEDDYLAAGQRYTQAIRQRNLQAIIDYDYNYEHPPLTKLIYGLAMLPLPETALLPETSSTLPPASRLPQPHFKIARLVSAAFGTLETLALALLNPLAGFFLAAHTWQIKYTSQIMLEPLPSLTSLLAVLCYVRWKSSRHAERSASETQLRTQAKRFTWLPLSALFLGITAASKYTYCVMGIAILVDWLWDILRPSYAASSESQPAISSPQSAIRNLQSAILWGVLAILIFFIFDPRLWDDPLGRLAQSLLYHGGYAQSEHVRQVGYPAWQPLVWLAGPVSWHPGVFLLPLDLYTSLFAILGLRRLWARQRVFALWLGIDLVFLLFWPTKWPQYILTLTAPLCLAAAQGFQATVWEPFTGWLQALWRGLHPEREALPKHPEWSASETQFRMQSKDERSVDAALARRLAWRDLRRALPWLLPGAIGLALIAFFPIIYQFAMSLTDFNAISFRDGIQGGIWRSVWDGLTGQAKPVAFDPFEGTRSPTVHYTGPTLLLALFGGVVPDILVFNILWMVLSVGLQTLLGVAAALMLNGREVRLAKMWQTIFILPWAIPEFVGALIWLRVLEPRYGWLAISQQLPAGVNLSSWTEDANLTLLFLLVAAVWYGFPLIMLAATAGLKLTPEDVYDAAAIDGAGSWDSFRHITWPLLLPLLAPAVIIRSIFAFNQFYLFYTMRVGYRTMTFATLSYLVFSPGSGGQFAVSAGLNIFTVLVLIVLILCFSRVSKAAEGVTYA